MAATIWIDVDDLLVYAATFSRPSGIQRLAFELYAALQEHYPDSIRFVRQDRLHGRFVTTDWADVTGHFARITAGASAPAAPSPALRRSARSSLRKLLIRLPPEVYAPLADGLHHQAEAVAKLGAAFGALLRLRHRRPTPVAASPRGVALQEVARPGDVLTAFGAPWFGPSHPVLLHEARTRLGLRVALLLYDIIPLRRPEWCDPAMTALFADWFHAVLPQADTIFAISRAAAEDVRSYAARAGVAMPAAVVPVPLGSGFTPPPPAPPAPGLPAPGSYVLFVSSLEPRKNHLLLVRAWRRLLDELAPERVPQLVFAGRIGAGVTDLLRELTNSRFLDGKVRLIVAPDDADLASLYRHCRFTVFPSLYEGWGLPVTESLAFGKPCLAANTSSVPEAGGSLARYFDPESVTDAVRSLRAVLDDPAALPAWEAEVRAGFRPVAWSETARAIVETLLPAERTA